VKRFTETGSLAPGQIGGHCEKKISGAHHEWLVQRCREREFNLRGLVAELAERGVVVSYRTVWKFVHAHKLSYKKNRSGGRAGSPGRRPQAVVLEEISGAD
jgi:putative transposase